MTDTSAHTTDIRGTVLLVDDEAPLREIQRRMLEQDGYAVLQAADGDEGIRAALDDVHIDLIVADLHMPVVSGEEMVRAIRSARPTLPVLYVTGRIDRLMDARPLDDTEAFLEKPFTAVGLQEAVSPLLFGTIGKRRTFGASQGVADTSECVMPSPAATPA